MPRISLCMSESVYSRRFFEGVSGIAFFGSDETGRHLYAGKTEGEVVLDVFLIVDSAAESESLSAAVVP